MQCYLVANFFIKMSSAFGLNLVFPSDHWVKLTLSPLSLSLSVGTEHASRELNLQQRFTCSTSTMETWVSALQEGWYVIWMYCSISWVEKKVLTDECSELCLKYCMCFQKPALNPSVKMPHVWKTIPLHTITAALAKMQNKCGFTRKWC